MATDAREVKLEVGKDATIEDIMEWIAEDLEEDLQKDSIPEDQQMILAADGSNVSYESADTIATLLEKNGGDILTIKMKPGYESRCDPASVVVTIVISVATSVASKLIAKAVWEGGKQATVKLRERRKSKKEEKGKKETDKKNGGNGEEK